MLEALSTFDGSLPARRQLAQTLDSYQAAVVASRGRGDRQRLLRAEADVKANPRACFFEDAQGQVTLHADGQRYHAGRFEVLSLRDLRARARRAQARNGQRPARLRLFLCDGAGPGTDIGALQAFAPPRSLFQVASQFNCLEAPGAFLTDVSDYLHDPTQGPRASVSAFPGALLRHYGAPSTEPDALRFVQTQDGPQLNLLHAVCTPGVASVHSGYLRPSDIHDPAAFATALEDRFDSLAVGVHSDVQVVLGCEWDGAVLGFPHHRISQVLTSTMAAGLYGHIDGGDDAIGRCLWSLQRAAYLGTLLAAAANGSEHVVLTLIGGGVFGNPIPLIVRAIDWALTEVAGSLHRDLTVLVNGRNLGEHIDPATLAKLAHARQGLLLRLDKGGVSLP
jgi:hypothetical protein